MILDAEANYCIMVKVSCGLPHLSSYPLGSWDSYPMCTATRTETAPIWCHGLRTPLHTFMAGYTGTNINLLSQYLQVNVVIPLK
jgi:hypothetical protein